MRTVGRDTLTHRSDAGPDDRALQLLIRRTPPHTHGAVRGAAAGGGGGRAGHTRGASHRPTAK
jgi:hypothetical protein